MNREKGVSESTLTFEHTGVTPTLQRYTEKRKRCVRQQGEGNDLDHKEQNHKTNAC